MRVLLILISIVLTSCATPYQSEGLTGGFSETQLAKNTWKISSRGNAYTSSSTVRDHVLLRASELTLENGFKYFVVGSSSEDVKRGIAKIGTDTSTTTGNITPMGNINLSTRNNSPTYIPTEKFSNEIVFRMVDESEVADETFVYEAELIYNSLAPKYIKSDAYKFLTRGISGL